MTDTSFVSQTFECNGQAIHAKLAGAEDAPVMVMLHENPGKVAVLISGFTENNQVHE